MEPGPPDKGAKKSERVNGRGETIVRLRALGFCTVQLLQEWADLSSRDHIGELSFGPGEEFDVPFSQAVVLLAKGRAKIVHDPE